MAAVYGFVFAVEPFGTPHPHALSSFKKAPICTDIRFIAGTSSEIIDAVAR